MRKNVCAKFCNGPVNTNKGIGCQLGYFDEYENWIPDPCKHNPLSQEAALNLIKNGGRNHICLQNPFRYI